MPTIEDLESALRIARRASAAASLRCDPDVLAYGTAAYKAWQQLEVVKRSRP